MSVKLATEKDLDTPKALHHRAWVEVDLSQLRTNLRNLIALVRPTQVAPVVKSEAYGHGMVAVALALEFEEIWGVCVVTPEEGMTLRQAGFTKEILVVGASFAEEMEQAVEAQVTLAVYDLEQARQVSQAAQKVGRAAKIHLKFDTGLSRLASTTDQAGAFYDQARKLPGLEIEGVYSHLADAEGLDQTYTLQQFRRFKECLAELEKQGLRPKLRHISASAASLLLSETRLNLVRFGISLYGYWPSRETRILHHGSCTDLAARLREEFCERPLPALAELFSPALAYRARVVQTKWVEAGVKIGYGLSYETQRRTRIAVLPVGYAEGYDRHLSNRGEVLLHGRRARLLGRVCMNLIVVDVTDIDQAQTGSVATLIGRDGAAQITAEEVAEKIGTIQYEVITRIPASIPRIYLNTEESPSGT